MNVQLAGRLDADPAAVAIIRETLARIGFDAAHQSLRADYHTTPFGHFEETQAKLPGLPPDLATAFRLLVLGEPVAIAEVEAQLGRAFAEAGLITGLMESNDQERFHTGGFTIVSLLGQHVVVSQNPYYPTFDPGNAGVYAGPDSYSLVNEVQRRASVLPETGAALELCAGSGIAGLRAALLRPGLMWTAVDLSPSAVNAANFNAALNGCADRYVAIESDLYAAIGDARFDLVIANPPFIPVPSNTAFPIYGDGGQDGLSVLGPLLRDLPRHLTETGRALIYAEGIGANGRLLVEDHLTAFLEAGWSVQLTVIASAPIENALYTLGLMLAHQRPSRLEEIVRWRDMFQTAGADHYAKFFVEVRPGGGTVTKRQISVGTRPA